MIQACDFAYASISGLNRAFTIAKHAHENCTKKLDITERDHEMVQVLSTRQCRRTDRECKRMVVYAGLTLCVYREIIAYDTVLDLIVVVIQIAKRADSKSGSSLMNR